MNKIANYDWSHLGDNNKEWRIGDKFKGGTKKIGDVPHPCSHPEHNPPSHCVFEPGIYEHTCPGCGRKMIFTVNGIYL